MDKITRKVKIQDELSDPFETTRGLRQGDGLACLPFNLVLEIAIKKSGVYREGTILSKSSHLLAYADDIDIIARLLGDLKQDFTSIERVARNMGLKINEENTRVLVSSTSRARTAKIGQTVTIKDYNFKVVNAFKYLGTNIDNENNITSKIKQNYNFQMYSNLTDI